MQLLHNTVYSFIFQTTKIIESTNRDDKTKIEAMDFASEQKYGHHEIIITEINFANIFVLGACGFLYMYISRGCSQLRYILIRINWLQNQCHFKYYLYSISYG